MRVNMVRMGVNMNAALHEHRESLSTLPGTETA